MQTFKESKGLAKYKDVNNLFRQNPSSKVSGEAETGAAGEAAGQKQGFNKNPGHCPIRNSRTSENEK